MLDGVFSDERGDYPAGTYVRNPIGSRHAPFSREGCTIFVKLMQFDPADRAEVVIDSHRAEWTPGALPGQRELALHAFAGEQVRLLRWAPGTAQAPQDYPGGAELLVLEGILQDERGEHPAGSWLRCPAQFSHHPGSTEGCLLWCKTGHLAP